MASSAWPNVWPEVQQRAPALLALVLGDDGGLDLAAAPDRVRQRRGVEAPQVVDVRLEPGEERGVDDDAVLDDLGEAGSRARAAATMRSVPVSAKTAIGWWNAPIMFFARG